MVSPAISDSLIPSELTKRFGIVPLVALETIGSDCFYQSISLNNGRFNSATRTLPPGVDLIKDEANDVYLAHYNSFSSRASGSLGASQPAAAVVKMALERQGSIKSISVPDELSMEALRLFAGEFTILLEDILIEGK